MDWFAATHEVDGSTYGVPHLEHKETTFNFRRALHAITLTATHPTQTQTIQHHTFLLPYSSLFPLPTHDHLLLTPQLPYSSHTSTSFSHTNAYAYTLPPPPQTPTRTPHTPSPNRHKNTLTAYCKHTPKQPPQHKYPSN